MLRTLRNVAGLILVAMALTAVGTPASAAEPEAASYRFTWEPTRPDLLTELDHALPNTSVRNLADGANRSARPCKAPVRRRVASFCWNDQDSKTRGWMPQGVTTSADASADGRYQDRELLIASWYDTTSGSGDKGVRVTFVDLTDPVKPKYRHVLLAEPVATADGADFVPIRIHAGGLAWYGDRLYVADTWRGIRVFDLSHLWQVSGARSDQFGHQDDDTYQGGGYGYVLAQAGLYRHSTDEGARRLRFSTLSLDRSSRPRALVAAEWAEPGSGSRLARVPLSAEGVPVSGEDGLVRCQEVHVVSIGSMQGASRVGDGYLVSTSDGDANGGDLATWSPGAKTQTEHDVFPPGPEGIAYWAARDQVWSLTEHPGQRYVYAMNPA